MVVSILSGEDQAFGAGRSKAAPVIEALWSMMNTFQ